MIVHVYVELNEVMGQTDGPRYEWRQVQAESISEAMELAKQMPDVVAVLEGSVIPGGVPT